MGSWLRCWIRTTVFLKKIYFREMKIVFKLSFILLSLILISSCSGSREFADQGLFQKRKFRKGYHLNLRTSGPKKAQAKNKNFELDLESSKLASVVKLEKTNESHANLKTESIQEINTQDSLKEVRIKSIILGQLKSSNSIFDLANTDKANKLNKQLQKLAEPNDQEKTGRFGILSFAAFCAGNILLLAAALILFALLMGPAEIAIVLTVFFFGLLGLLLLLASLILAIVALVKLKDEEPSKMKSVDTGFAIATLVLIFLFFVSPLLIGIFSF